MSYVGDDWLIEKALAAIDEAAEAAQSEPIRRTIALRVVLALLASRYRCDRWPFDKFWQALAMQDDLCRRANITASANAIHRAVSTGRCR